jgi:hypothetical protein
MGSTNSKIFDALRLGKPPMYALKSITWAKALYARAMITHPEELSNDELEKALKKLQELEGWRVRDFNHNYMCPMCPFPIAFHSKRELGEHKKSHRINSLKEVKSWKKKE